MATITSAQSGNFSDTATWVGGVVPGASDDAVAATGHVVAIDVDVTVLSVQQAGTGKFTLGNGRTLTGNVIANAGTFTSGGTVEVTATSGNTATINGNVSGVSSTANNVAGVVVTGTGVLVLNGSVTGSAGNASSSTNGHAGVYTNATCTITINGAVTGGAGANKRGFQSGASSNGTFTIVGTVNGGSNIDTNGAFTLGISPVLIITGDVTGGSGTASVAARTEGTSGSITITGNVIGGSGTNAYGALTLATSANMTITGNITASSNAVGAYSFGSASLANIVGNLFAAGQASHAFRSDASSANSGVVLTGNMTDSSLGATALYGRIFRLNSTPSGITTYTNNVGYPTGGSVTRVSPDNVTGMPAASDVRKPLTYGYSNQLTGTMAIPAAGSVKFGVPTDNTVGSAELDLGRVAEVVGLQVAAGKST